MTDQSDTTVKQAYDPVSQIGRRRYEDDQFIFRQHESGDQAYIIDSGQVEILIESSESLKTLRILSKGAMFGEMALIDDEPRMASARAVNGHVDVLVINRKIFKNKLEGADPFIRGLLNILADTARSIV
jgi:CRP-like cAMP-binding protein